MIWGKMFFPVWAMTKSTLCWPLGAPKENVGAPFPQSPLAMVSVLGVVMALTSHAENFLSLQTCEWKVGYASPCRRVNGRWGTQEAVDSACFEGEGPSCSSIWSCLEALFPKPALGSEEINTHTRSGKSWVVRISVFPL